MDRHTVLAVASIVADRNGIVWVNDGPTEPAGPDGWLVQDAAERIPALAGQYDARTPLPWADVWDKYGPLRAVAVAHETGLQIIGVDPPPVP